MDNSPKKLEDYLSVRKVVKAHIYESNWYKESGSHMMMNEKDMNGELNKYLKKYI